MAWYLVVQVLADHRGVRRDEDGLEVVDGRELERFRIRRSGHARELVVEAEIVLERDRGERLALVLDGDAFFGLHGLVQSVRPAAPLHHAAGELVDDHDLVVHHDVVLVAVIERVRPNARIQVMHEDDVRRVVEARARWQQSCLLHQLLGALVALLGERHLVLLQVDVVVTRRIFLLLLAQFRDEEVDAPVELGRVLGLPRDDERRARLVDEDRVDLVDDRVAQPFLLEALRHLRRHVVAQVVEAELVVGAVGDVGEIGRLLVRVLHLRHDDTHGEPEEAVDAAHPLGIALREVVGAHLRDLAFVQRDAADQLHVEMPHLQHALRRLAHDGEGLRQDLVQPLAIGHALLELRGHRGEIRIAHLLEARLERVDRVDGLAVLLEEAVVAAAEDGLENGVEHEELRDVGGGKAQARC